MFERTDLEELTAFEGKHPVVSLYLNLPSHLRATPDGYRARLKTLLRQVQDRASGADLSAIEQFFEAEFDWVGRSVAVFSGEADGLWRAHPFSVPLRSYVHVGEKPFIMPLADLMETYGSCVVALVNHQSMKLYHIQLGEISTSETISGDEVRNLSATGGSRQDGTVRGSSPSTHNREIVKANWRVFADALDGFARQSKATALLLAGSEETVVQFKEMLASQWRTRLHGMFTASMMTADKDIREQALAKLQEHQKAVQIELVDSIRAAAARAANGIVGAADTLEALHSGRVHTLALVEGLQTPGYRCTGCGFVTTVASDSCQFCGNTLAAIPNVAEYAVRQVVDQGGTVEFLEAGTPLDQVDGMAALLRY